MKKIPTLLTLLLGLLLLLQSQAQNSKHHIDFQQKGWPMALKEAQRANKHIFVSVYADYCLASKIMENQVFNQSVIAQFYNQNFINYQFDVSNPAYNFFIDLYGLKNTPKYLYFNKKGNLLYQLDGQQNATVLMQLGQQIIDKKTKKNITLDTHHDDAIQLQLWQQKYENEGLSKDNLRKYAYLLKQQHLPYNRVVNDYLHQQNINLQSIEMRQFIFDFSKNLENNAILHLLNDILYYRENYSNPKIDNKVKAAIYSSICDAIPNRNSSILKTAYQVAIQAKLPDAPDFLFRMEQFYYKGIGDWESYVKVTNSYLKNHAFSDESVPLVNHIARHYYFHISEKSNLKRAVKWLKTTINNAHPSSQSYLTLSALLFKLNQSQEAKKAAKQAIYLAQQDGRNTRLMRTWLQKNERGNHLLSYFPY